MKPTLPSLTKGWTNPVDGLTIEQLEAIASELPQQETDNDDKPTGFMPCNKGDYGPPTHTIQYATLAGFGKVGEFYDEDECLATAWALTVFPGLVARVKELEAAVTNVYNDAENYADGAPDASEHDKMCNRITGKLSHLFPTRKAK